MDPPWTKPAIPGSKEEGTKKRATWPVTKSVAGKNYGRRVEETNKVFLNFSMKSNLSIHLWHLCPKARQYVIHSLPSIGDRFQSPTEAQGHFPLPGVSRPQASEAGQKK